MMKKRSIASVPARGQRFGHWYLASTLILPPCLNVQAEEAPTYARPLERPTILKTLPPHCMASTGEAERGEEEATKAKDRVEAYQLKRATVTQPLCKSFRETQLAPVEGSRFRFWPPGPEVVENLFQMPSSASVAPASTAPSSMETAPEETEIGESGKALIALCERNRFGRNMCGLQDSAGQLLVPLKFDEARPNPASDLQAVRFENRWGYFSLSQQRLIVVPQFVKVGDFKQGSAFVETSDKPTRTWLIDENGNRIKELPLGAQISGQYEEGLSLLKFDQRFGYIDERGGVVIAAQFVNAAPFSSGLAFVQYSEAPDQYALIDRHGEGQLFFQFPDTRLLPLGDHQYLALSGCNSRNGCLARCLSLEVEGASGDETLSKSSPASLEVSCLAQEDDTQALAN